MFEKNKTEELCSKILEENGGLVADRARTILLEDPVLRGLRPPLEFIAQSWRDPLTPALVNLSCMAVDGHKNKTYEAALAMSLITLSCNIWDDIVDETSFRLFKPTLREKFGEATALMIGGLASAKAFSILDQLDERMINRHNIVELIWEFCAKIAKAETVNLRLRSQRNVTPRKRLWVIKAQAINLETCMKIGARIGCGSETQVEQLGKYGLYLSTILELWKDFHVSVNLTLTLPKKLEKWALPYPLLRARERPGKTRKKLDILLSERAIGPSDVKELVENILETNALKNTVKIIQRFAKKGKGELAKTGKNNATQTLQLLIEAQPILFMESLSKLNGQSN